MTARGRLTALVAVGLSALGVKEARGSCERPFDDPNDVLTFHLRMTRADWDKLRRENLDQTTCPSYTRFPARFRCGETEPWIEIAARQKRGQQRGVELPEKPPIKLDFNHVVAAQAWPAAMGRLGYRKLSLNNGQPDAPGGLLSVLQSEHFAWRLLKREVPESSGSAYARLYLQFEGEAGPPQYKGLYVVVEDIDRAALRRRYGEAVGRLVKTTNPTAACRDEVEFDDGGDNTAHKAFEAWAKTMPSATPAVWAAATRAAMDLDLAFRQEALRDAIANHDTLMGTLANNYYAFDPLAGKRRYLPWDLDDAFGLKGFTQQLPVETPMPTPYCGPFGQRTKCHPALERAYFEVVCDLVNGALNKDRMVAEWDALDRLLRPLVKEEAPLLGAGKDPLAETTTLTWGTYASEHKRLRTWIGKREEVVRSQVARRGIVCPRGCAAGAVAPCPYLGCQGERRCEGGLWTSCQPGPACRDPVAVSAADASAPRDGADADATAAPLPDAATSDARAPSGTPPAQAPGEAMDAGPEGATQPIFGGCSVTPNGHHTDGPAWLLTLFVFAFVRRARLARR